MKLFRLTSHRTIKVYHGYGYNGQLVIFGHVLSLSPLPRKKYSDRFWVNLFSLIRLFLIKPVVGAHVQLCWDDQLINGTTESDGFFRMEWKTSKVLQFGWQEVLLNLLDKDKKIITSSNGFIFIPHFTQYGFISDIDDTFLISHSSNLRKRLFVLFTNNARSRKPFEGVANHYKLLSLAHTKEEEPNPFFYVSSSEWNLYDYIVEFTKANHLPRGVYFLSQIKGLREIFKTGQNKHGAKFMRIVRIMEMFPKQKFVLLGDSSQQDPFIYLSIVEHFPGRIHAVYIRNVYKKSREKVNEALLKLEGTGVAYCFFTHSAEAIIHSRQIGLIQ
ncbi:MAG: DUF2183 domain-containing protein [Chitinophagaceae bacterium]|nr:DUF2183 domain-containing protein [Chitinophagaceae bacterium]